MCGISGFNWSDEKLIMSMMDKMNFRGPDDSGFFVDSFASFGHVRLSILDTSSAGHQPMFCSDNKIMIIYNGEIYNSPEIRLHLEEQGFIFNSLTDTEVVLNSYKHWGEKCLEKFRGMFAFAIYDKDKKNIFLARDHAGIKPLYYFISDNKFIFSSTIKSLFESPIKKNYNKKTIRDFLLYNTTDHLEVTFFDKILKFPKGSYAIYDLEMRNLKFTKWWKNEFTGDYKGSYSSAVKTLRSLFFKSIDKHLLSDVTLGISLSGGIDSSSIASVIDKMGNSEISTFSAVFPGFHKDESNFINKLCEEKNFTNHKIELKASDLSNDFSSFVDFNEEPLPTPSPYAQYKVLELAKKKKTVVILEGQGADELFAGYPYFFGFLVKGLISKGKYFTALREILQIIKGGSFRLGIYSIFFLILPLHIQKRYFENRSFASKDLISEEKIETDFFSSYYSCNSLHSSLKFHLDYKLEHLLKWGDRNSMAHSRESRVPFLDQDLLKFVFKLPEKYLLSMGKTKLILRDSMLGILPSFISDRRDKIGFATPENIWLRDSSISPYIDNFLYSEPLCKNFINLKKVRFALNKLLKGSKIDTREIWKIIMLEKWMENNNLKS